MSETKELTLKEVAPHNTKKDLFMVIHGKVYDSTNFIDEHPGGEEVLLDLGGQDASEAFEDVGHSDEAREILDGLLVGNLKREAGDPEPKAATSTTTATVPKDTSGLGVGVYAFLLLGGVVAFVAFQYLQNEKK